MRPIDYIPLMYINGQLKFNNSSKGRRRLVESLTLNCGIFPFISVRINKVIMTVKSKRNLIVIISLFLTFCVLVYSYAYNFGSSLKPLSVLQKLKIFQPTKEVQSSILRETKMFPDMKMMKSVTSEESMRISGISDIKSNNRNREPMPKIQTNIQRRNITNITENFKIGSDNCTKKKVTLSRTKLPITGLVSFPGSGNTWTRHLIQQMTGTNLYIYINWWTFISTRQAGRAGVTFNAVISVQAIN